MSAMVEANPPRILLVFSGDGWYVRSVRIIEHDLDLDEKVYHCDHHLGGPFTLEEGCHFLRAWYAMVKS